jgi:hypothetical protein
VTYARTVPGKEAFSRASSQVAGAVWAAAEVRMPGRVGEVVAAAAAVRNTRRDITSGLLGVGGGRVGTVLDWGVPLR